MRTISYSAEGSDFGDRLARPRLDAAGGALARKSAGSGDSVGAESASNSCSRVKIAAIASAKLESLRKYAESAAVKDELQQAHLSWAVSQIKRYRENPKEIPVSKPMEAPPGQPIGCDDQP